MTTMQINKSEKWGGQRGFITVATGSKKYYRVAANLLKSYRYFTKNPLPFAILADEENEYTDLFDDVIILKNPSYSYLDKIHLLNNLPYKETLFVESDCLAYGDLNEYFEGFIDCGDFAVFGTNYELEHQFKNEWGWFEPQKLGKYSSLVKFIPRFGSTFMYMREGEICKKMYDICLDIWNHAGEYGFLPLDDQLLAVALAVVDCRCVHSGRKYDCCVYPFYKEHKWKPRPQMHKGVLSYVRPDYGRVEESLICHWGNYLTTKNLYKREVFSLNCLINNKKFIMKCGVVFYDFLRPFSNFAMYLEKILKMIYGCILENRKLRKMFYPLEKMIKVIKN